MKWDKERNEEHIIEDRQCTYNVTMRRVHATTIAEERVVLHILNVCL